MQERFIQQIFEKHQQCSQCPTTEDISRFFEDLLGIIFPNFTSKPVSDVGALRQALEYAKSNLKDVLETDEILKNQIADEFFGQLDRIYELLLEDVEAIYEGDPAAKSREEVIRSYPGFYAIAAYRVAHLLLKLGSQLLPRSITEYAHSKTGIDIHPAATIGHRFCIDHGTGVVIGETTQIGDDVKIYQGVTLGALSVEKELANTKRHPTIGNRVVIYSGATVLGGNTHIGEDSIIGGNVWLAESVPPSTQVYYRAPNEHKIKSFN